tara:strand:+ start:286 stop:1578 length:1293 start_codon:yes stop_codon:yes gene_type:complete
MKNSYQQTIDGCLAEEIGDSGLTQDELGRYVKSTERVLENLRREFCCNNVPFLMLPTEEEFSRINEVAQLFRGRFSNVLVLGTGGSSLGGKTLCALAPKTAGPNVHFLDNIDPLTIDGLVTTLDWANTGILAISKSGFTTETLTQLAVFVSVLREHVRDQEVSEHIVVVTDASDSPLTEIARNLGCVLLKHPLKIGGRYSVFSISGILPARIKGLDVEEVQSGASEVVGLLNHSGSVEQFPPAVGAATAVGLSELKKLSTSVFMTYSDELSNLGLWYCQLCAESLGKDGKGITPIRATGTVDQHSQLQLYLAGPPDKMFSLILTDTSREGLVVSDEFSTIDHLSYLKGRTIGDVFAAAGNATALTLGHKGRPTRLFKLPKVDERSIGALMMHLMIETVVVANLIGVDPYNQPAVEAGKELLRQQLGQNVQ